MSGVPVIDCTGQRFNIFIAELAVKHINEHGGVAIINCAGADLTELVEELVRLAQRVEAVDAT